MSSIRSIRSTVQSVALATTCAFALSGPAIAQDKLVAGVDGTFAPHAMPKLGGGVEGFNIDMIEAIGKKIGQPIEVFAGEFSGLIPGMNAGKISFVGAPTTVTPERAKSLLFTEGYLNTYYQFVVPAGKPDVTTLDQLKGMTISVNKGSAYDKWGQTNKEKYGFEIAAFPTNADAVQALISGRADAHISGNTVAAYSVTKAKDKMKLATLVVDDGRVWGAAFRKEDAALRNQVEEAIECLKQDGTLSALSEKWFGVKPTAEQAQNKVFPGYGVPGMDGYDPTPSKANCS
ncbi:MAG: transporter substrate-binding domain-containing protein [Burkholderiaceae bacterium]